MQSDMQEKETVGQELERKSGVEARYYRAWPPWANGRGWFGLGGDLRK